MLLEMLLTIYRIEVEFETGPSLVFATIAIILTFPVLFGDYELDIRVNITDTQHCFHALNKINSSQFESYIFGNFQIRDQN